MKRFVRMICWLFIAVLLGSSDRAMAQPDKDFVSRLIMSSGGAVGNGGGTIVCRNPDLSIRSIEVLDLFEARILRKNPADLESFEGDWRAKVRAVIERLGKVSELRERIYSDWLASFEEEAMVLEGVDFNNIPDAMNIGIPKGCEFVQVAVQIMPRFTGDHRYYLNGQYWRAMDDTQKAALVLHEIVYREALSYGHTDSVATRYFMGHIASPKILTEDSWSIIPTLKQVRFEQTDVPIELGFEDIDTEFMPVNWWRSFYDDEDLDPNRKEKPKSIRLKGRIVINVGVCQNSGCSDWESFWTTKSGPTLSCSGLSSIRIGDDVISVPISIYKASGGDEIRCDRRVNFDTSRRLTPDLQIEYLKLQTTGRRPTGSRYGDTLTFDILGSVTAFQVAYQKIDGRYEKTSVSTDVFEDQRTDGRNLYRAYTKDPGKPCFLKLNYLRGKVFVLNRGETDLANSECYFAAVQTVGYFTIALSFDSSDAGVREINFDPNGLYSSGGRINYMGTSSMSYSCFANQSDCYIASEVSNGVPTQMSVQSKSALLGIHIGSDAACAVNEGILDLYPTLIPKQISLAEPCELKKVNGSFEKYPAGSIVRLNEDGVVLQRVQ